VTSVAMLFFFPVQNFTEIGQSAAELWPKTIFKWRLSAILKLFFGHVAVSELPMHICVPSFIKIG